MKAEHFGFQVFLKMAPGPIAWIVLSLQAAHHQSPFERAHDQRGQFRRIDLAADLASSLPFLDNRSEAIKPRVQRVPGLLSQPRISIVGIDGRVERIACRRRKQE